MRREEKRRAAFGDSLVQTSSARKKKKKNIQQPLDSISSRLPFSSSAFHVSFGLLALNQTDSTLCPWFACFALRAPSTRARSFSSRLPLHLFTPTASHCTRQPPHAIRKSIGITYKLPSASARLCIMAIVFEASCWGGWGGCN